MNVLIKSVLIVLVMSVFGFPIIGIEHARAETIDVFDFKQTPVSDVIKVFTELTGKNVVASQDIMELRITLFLKEVTPKEALKTMCKLYNLWFAEEGNVVRIMSTKDYGRELTVRRDEKTSIYKLKYASCFAVADLLNALFGSSIEYIEPDEIESYGHIGTEEEAGAGARGKHKREGYSRDNYRSHTRREAYIPMMKESIEIEGGFSPKALEELEKKSKEKEVGLKDVLEAGKKQAIVYMAIFPRNNSIFARSVDSKILNDIGDFIKRIDSPTSQVLLEGKILEITLTDDFTSFFDFDVTSNKEKHILNLGNFASLNSSTLIYRFINSDIQARVEMFLKDNRVKVIGTPMILSANNASGEFFIGEERPIIVNYEQEIREFEDRTTETIRPVIELRDIGTKIIITPSINEDRTVTMRFLAEVDTVKPDGAEFNFVTNEGKIIALPIDTVDTSRVENIIIAKDNSTLAIGGLIRETMSDYEQKVPLLGDLPILGFFFKRNEEKKERTETVFLITPHIMMAPQESEAVSDETMSGLSDHPYVRHKQKRLLGEETFQKSIGEIISINPEYNFIVISLGKNDGIEIDDIFPIYREDEFIGTVKVAKIRQETSIAYPIKQSLIKKARKGDNLRRFLC